MLRRADSPNCSYLHQLGQEVEISQTTGGKALSNLIMKIVNTNVLNALLFGARPREAEVENQGQQNLALKRKTETADNPDGLSLGNAAFGHFLKHLDVLVRSFNWGLVRLGKKKS